MVGWFDVVCIQRKHEDTKLIKSHGSYQQASMRCCLFGEDQELSYEGLPWSTMVYHIKSVCQDDRDLREERQKMGVENAPWKRLIALIALASPGI